MEREDADNQKGVVVSEAVAVAADEKPIKAELGLPTVKEEDTLKLEPHDGISVDGTRVKTEGDTVSVSMTEEEEPGTRPGELQVGESGTFVDTLTVKKEELHSSDVHIDASGPYVTVAALAKPKAEVSEYDEHGKLVKVIEGQHADRTEHTDAQREDTTAEEAASASPASEGAAAIVSEEKPMRPVKSIAVILNRPTLARSPRSPTPPKDAAATSSADSQQRQADNGHGEIRERAASALGQSESAAGSQPTARDASASRSPRGPTTLTPQQRPRTPPQLQQLQQPQQQFAPYHNYMPQHPGGYNQPPPMYHQPPPAQYYPPHPHSQPFYSQQPPPFLPPPHHRPWNAPMPGPGYGMGGGPPPGMGMGGGGWGGGYGGGGYGAEPAGGGGEWGARPFIPPPVVPSRGAGGPMLNSFTPMPFVPQR